MLSVSCPAAHSPLLDGFTSKEAEIPGNPPVTFGTQLLRASARREGEAEPTTLGCSGHRSSKAGHICQCFELQSAAGACPGPALPWSSSSPTGSVSLPQGSAPG